MAASALEPGLILTIRSNSSGPEPATDVLSIPKVALYVPAGDAPTPFVPPGPFSAVWEGFISAELRSDFIFEAETSGVLELAVNGKVVLTNSLAGPNFARTKAVRLLKGTNAFRIVFQSSLDSDSYLRLFWFNKETPRGPVPPSALSHPSNHPQLARGEKLRRGRELFFDLRCAKCHVDLAPDRGAPELAIEAPSLEEIGGRLNAEWMEKWILDPKSIRPSARMPRMLEGPTADADARAVAAYLASLPTNGAPTQGPAPKPAGLGGLNRDEIETLRSSTNSAGQVEGGRQLFQKLHCSACHLEPGLPPAGPDRIPLGQAGEKFREGKLQLALFLMKPDRHYSWTRMPNFKLAPTDAAQLATFLCSIQHPTIPKTRPRPDDVLGRGRELVQTSGCLNCHPLRLENKFKPPPTLRSPLGDGNLGCLRLASDSSSRAPRFGLAPDESDALQALLATDRSSFGRSVASDFSERHSRLLNCHQCHGKIEGVPVFDNLGEKLRPEWARSFIAGEIAEKPRPWLESRMPAFPAWAEGLAAGLANQHGYPASTPAEPPIDPNAAKIGQELVSPLRGFACISCHAIGEFGANQVVESPGVNLAQSGSRLLKSYFQRWVRNPLSIDPTSKMPVYFDEEGRSPLTDYYEGDGAKQIDALWEFIRLGREMGPPPLQ
jgi:mono/diheme cytochrome c family protein